ncbi:MAG: DUF3822 family protein [Flavobacteriales bacterium]|nr:DUF3822 family protein [Flavobacteriales bacterium]
MVTGKKTDFHNHLRSISSLGDKHLGILIGGESFRIALSDNGSDDTIAYFNFDNISAEEIIKTFKLFGMDLGSVDIYSSDPQVTLIPEGIFAENNADEIIEAVYGESRKHSLHSYLESLQLYSIFRMEKEISLALGSCFPQMHVHHLADTVITQSWAQRSFSSGHYFRLHLEGHALFIALFNGKELLLFNTQYIREATDLVYHVLNTVQSSKVDNTSAEIGCSGELMTESESFILLKSYCPKTEFIQPKNPNSDSRDFILDNHRYCEL